MKFSENFTFIPMLKAADHEAGADTDSVNMGLLHSLCLQIQAGSVTTAGPEIKAYSGASAGTKTTALVMKYRLGSAAAKSATADVLGAWQTSVAADGITFGTSDDDKLLVIEMDSTEMTAGEPWLTFEIDADADAFFAGVVAIADPRQANVTVIGA